MKEQRIKQILDQIKKVNIAVYGDFCLDAYWILDPAGSERSVETGQQGRAISKHYYSLGGASNVVANLSALEPKSIQVIGVIGDDIFGRELTRQLHQLNVDTTYLVVQKEDFDTVTFGKPYLEGSEQPRVDFGFFNRRTEATDKALLDGIRHGLQAADALIVNQQVPGSITNESFIEQANSLFEKFSDRIVLLDTRHYGQKFRFTYRKTNDLEAARLNGVSVNLDDVIDLPDLIKYGQNLYRRFNKPVFLTRGPRGILTIDSQGVHQASGIQLLKKLDPVGAGDTVTSALALCLGAGFAPAEAAEFANFAASVTVQKLFQTGTASGDEILEVARDPDYIYQPELACDRRKARYLEDTEIELCYGFPPLAGGQSIPLGRIKHALFDNDGTISTLRQGWEQIMAPVMIKAILGDKYQIVSETLYNRVKNHVLEYIDKSTGIQTILQMDALVEMVKQFGLVRADEILDKFGYKEIYNDALMELVNQRIEKLRRGELDVSDYTIKGGVAFLKALRNRGVKLYLASGTDHQDVVAESRVLEYAELFDDRIYGAIGDVTKCSKKMVIERIMTENRLEGPELAVFGDGPVELRECRKREGIAVGVASDEIRRHGLNIEKRTRLVKAGAHIIVPDFSQHKQLIQLIFN
jgi:bifunctional ADP-heptose synthase (sugar kinase/adenylyltransferase)/phosphoglycolate phosphatase-like HAD superfamily hydrolase